MAVNGKWHLITKNLRNFLDVLVTTKFRKSWFWADQISIDQNNLSERGHQVTLMSKIYSDCAEVFASLGGDMLHPIASFEVFSSQYGSALDRKLSNRLPGENEANALFEIFRRPYWTRLWIVQELRLAREVTFWCGRSSMKRQDLWRAYKWLEKNEHLIDWAIDQEHIAVASQVQWMNPQIQSLVGRIIFDDNNDLLTVLGEHWKSECADERDRIFGVQALVTPEQRIAIDYTKDMNYIMHEVARTAILRATPPGLRYGPPAFIDPAIEKILAQTSLLQAQLSAKTTYSHDPAQALFWAHRMRRIDKYVRATFTGWNDVSKMQEQCLCLWNEIAASAELPKQKKVAYEIGCQAAERTAELKMLAENGPSSIIAFIIRLIFFAVTKHGFLMYGEFLYHPDEWPFVKEVHDEGKIVALDGWDSAEMIRFPYN